MSSDGVAGFDFQTVPDSRKEPKLRRRDASSVRQSALGTVFVALALLGVAAPASAAAAGSEPVGGRMCVHPINAVERAGDCGPVEIAMLDGNRAVVRISDIVYRLQLHANLVDIVLMHGAMQIDEFSASYDWQGKTLHFSDPEKGVRYEIDFEPKADPATR